MAHYCAWKLIYTNNPDGSRHSGTLSDLVAAVRGGADVQVGYSLFDESVGRTDWRRTTHHVSVGQESAAGVPVVSCTFVDIPDSNYDLVDGRKFDEDPFAFEWQIFNTTGVRDRVKFDQRTRAVINHVVDRQRIAWYIRGYKPPIMIPPIFRDAITRWRQGISQRSELGAA